MAFAFVKVYAQLRIPIIIIYTNDINEQSLLLLASITTPTALVSAYQVTYEGFFDSECAVVVSAGTFLGSADCSGFEVWPISSYKLYHTGADTCPEGTSLHITYFGQDGRLDQVCGLEPLLVLPIGKNTGCVKGLNISPVSAQVDCI